MPGLEALIRKKILRIILLRKLFGTGQSMISAIIRISMLSPVIHLRIIFIIIPTPDIFTGRIIT
jgi:hypothetical protein